jgi:hypothetical protein
MSVQLDHLIVPARDRNASAELLATLLGVPWAESDVGPFSPVSRSKGQRKVKEGQRGQAKGARLAFACTLGFQVNNQRASM